MKVICNNAAKCGDDCCRHAIAHDPIQIETDHDCSKAPPCRYYHECLDAICEPIAQEKTA